MTTVDRVAVLGFPADASILARGIREGWLPTTAAFAAEGRAALLRHPEPELSIAHWRHLLTGRRAAEHLGIYWRLRSGTYRFDFDPSGAAMAPPFWSAASDAGRRCVVMGAQGIRLVEGLRGVQVGGWGMPARFGPPRSDPPEMLARLEARAGSWKAVPLRVPRDREERIELGAHLVRRVRQAADGIVALAGEVPWDLLFGSVAEPHDAEHLLWPRAARAGAPVPDPRSDLPADDPLFAAHRALDAELPRILDALPDGTAILFVSPQGMQGNARPGDPIPQLLARGGWLARSAAVPGALDRGRRLARRLLPRAVRGVIGRRIPRHRWDADLGLAGVDWKRTRAFPIPTHSMVSLVRANLAGREPAGTVAPGPEYGRVCEDVATMAGELVDAETGRLVVQDVVRIAGGDAPPTGGLPDLSVMWSGGDHPVWRYRSPSLGEVEVRERDPRPGMHRPDGYVLARVPDVDPDGRDGFSLEGSHLDVGPTVLRLLDVPLPGDLPGSPLEEMLP